MDCSLSEGNDAAARAQGRDCIAWQRQASRNQFVVGECDGGYQRARRRDFGKASWVASEAEAGWVPARAGSVPATGSAILVRHTENVPEDAEFRGWPEPWSAGTGMVAQRGLRTGWGAVATARRNKRGSRGVMESDVLLWRSKGSVRPGRRIPEESEPQFQLDLVPGRGGVVPERGVGDAPWQFADGADERGDFGGVPGGGDLLWKTIEAADGAWKRAGSAGIGYGTGVGRSRDDSAKRLRRPMWPGATVPAPRRRRSPPKCRARWWPRVSGR